MTRHTVAFTLRGLPALLCLLLLMGLGLVNLPFGRIDDPRLKREIETELRGAQTRAVLRELQAAVAQRDGVRTGRIAGELQAPLSIEELRVSAPLFRASSRSDSVVRVEFTLNGRSQTRFYRCRYSMLTGWEVRAESSRVMFYLNFL